jgi:hypothetical protein
MPTLIGLWPHLEKELKFLVTAMFEEEKNPQKYV